MCRQLCNFLTALIHTKIHNHGVLGSGLARHQSGSAPGKKKNQSNAVRFVNPTKQWRHTHMHIHDLLQSDFPTDITGITNHANRY